MTAAVLLGALAGADRTAVGQTLLAHPVIAALLAASLAGCPERALPFALAVGLISASTLPVGERALRDWTSAAVVVPFVVGPASSDTAWGLGLLYALAVAVVGGGSIAAVREWVRRRTAQLDPAIDRGDLGALERAHLGFTALYPLRAALVCAIAHALGRPLLGAVEGALAGPETAALAVLWKVAPWVGLPVLFRFHLGLGSWRWIAGGAGLGLGLLAWGVWP